MEKVINTTLEENLSMIESTVAYMKRHDKYVVFDAEHFFDGFKANPEYAFLALTAAVRGGAGVLCLCDTNGGTFPTDIGDVTQKAVCEFPGVQVGIHCNRALDHGKVLFQSGVNHLFHVEIPAPVSYTNLDVYKRQIM